MRNLTTAHPYRIPAILAFLAIAAILAFTTIMTVSAQSGPDWRIAPTGLTATAGDAAGELDVAWDPLQPNGKTLSDYHVTWAPDGEDFKKRNQTEWHAYPTTNEVSVTGLDAGATYQVKVRARYDDNKKSDWSDVISGQAGITTNSPATVPVDWSLIPSGLSDGDQFRLMFLSSTTRNASSSDIADYNTFIQDRAAAGHPDIQAYSDGFTVVGCTTNVDARDNTGTTYTSANKGVPIYWLDGNKAADDYEDFYDGNWDDEVNNKNESGANGPDTSQFTNHPFTGCDDDGTEAYNSALSAALGSQHVRTGSPSSNNGGPISGSLSPQSTNPRPMYGLSAVFTVGEVTPEETVVDGTPVLDTWSLIPSGLSDGDQFRLMFLSSTTRNASSSDIADYNTFIQDRAAAGHDDIQAYSDGFSVVGCTATVDARDNTATTGIGVPIYWLGGNKVADDYADFYDGNWDEEVNDKDESGANGPDTSQFDNYPFTGCDNDGTEAFTSSTSNALGTGHVRVGSPDGNNVNTGPIFGPFNPPATDTHPYYGLSAVFTVAEAPEVTVEVDHDWSLIPSGMSTGDQFRLMFLSSNKRDATDTSIDVYNTWIQTQVAAGHADIQAYSDGFTVVGCTADDDARDNTGTTYTRANKGIPIYWLNGNKVADNYQDFYDGSWDDEADDRNESGNDAHDTSQFANYPWTGCDNDGTEASIGGSNALGNVTVSIGRLGIGAPINSPATDTHPLYGISAVFTVREAPVEAVEVDHDWSLIPSGVSAGDQFRLIFLSSTKRDASSSDIEVYNAWIQSRVTAGHAAIHDYSDDFRVVGCTPDDDARDNTSTRHDSNDRGVPIYWVNGNKVADNYQDFYDGSWDDEINDKDESGTDGPDTSQSANYPFTGCADNGTESFNFSLSAALGNPTGFVRAGSPDSNNGPIAGPYNPASTDTRPMYGLSTVFQVAEAPEETVVEGDAEGTPVLDSWSLVPNGLTTGDKFRLMFLSSTTRNASSSDIADYNTFVQDRAAAGHADIKAYSDGFTVVGCTAAVHARNNTASNFTSANKGVPIYWLGGAKAADDYEDFYDGSWDDEVNDKNEFSTNGPDTSQSANHPFTGCDDDGTEAFNSALSAALGNPTGLVRTGSPDGNNSNTGPISGPFNPTSTDTRPMYGISAVFTVAEGTTEETVVEGDVDGNPVPDTWSLIPSGLSDGDQFRLMFLSSVKRDGSSSDIADYNTFIQDRTYAGHSDIQAYSDGFTVVGCTEDVYARNNTATNFTSNDKGVPIYWVNGNKIADDYEDFYDGSWDDETNNKDESGTNGPDTSQSANQPFTGCDDDGTEAFNSDLSAALGNPTGLVRTGSPGGNNGPISGTFSPPSTDNRPLYGLSAVFTVAEGTTEETVVEGDVEGTLILDTWSLVPTGLTTGDQFRLMFLSSTKRNARSSDIANYNTFVQDRAADGHTDIKAYSDGFTVVGCTEDVHARDNTATNFTSANKGIPIYWLNGAKVADDYEDFYDGSWDDETNNKDESGANGDTSQGRNQPFTGCADNGTEAFNSHLSAALGNPTGPVRIGSPGSNNGGPISGTSNPNPRGTRPFYGLSDVFTVEDLSDATLSALSLAGDAAIILTPAFDPTTTDYTAEVTNTVESISLTASQNKDGAAISVMDGDGNSIPDTAQIDLQYGENIISIVVTAQDGTTTMNYQATVTRAFAWHTTMTVGERLTAIPQGFGYTIWGEDMGSLSTQQMVMNGTRHRILSLMRYAGGLYLNINPALPGDFTLTMDGQDFLARESAEPPTPAAGRYWWDASGINWVTGNSLKVSIVPVPGSESLPARQLAPPIAEFKRIPESHNGSDQFTFKLNFTAEVSLSPKTMKVDAFQVTKGIIKKAERDEEGSNLNWTITVEPYSEADIVIQLPATQNCAAIGAICTSEGMKLFNTTEFTVRGPSTQ